MKKYLLLFSFVISVVILLPNFTLEKSAVSSFVFSLVSESPVLPETPYAYSDIEFPAHLFNNSTEDPGYAAGEIDTNSLNIIDDNISTLGRVLFYDKKLSAIESISCASCHDQTKSFADEEALSEGVNTPTKRNSMHLNDIAWTNNSSFFWDMSQTDLKEMIKLPLIDENELGVNFDEMVVKLSLTDYYPTLFQKAYGTDEITEDRIADALINFISSMVTFDSKFDHEAGKGFTGFTNLELEGKELFQINCTVCHAEGKPLFFEGESIINIFPFLFNNGLPQDTDDIGAGEWAPGFDHLFKLPSLRNIEKTGPYMHDGRFETLRDVIDFYSDDVEDNKWTFLIPSGGFAFTENDKDALEAFLNTLTDESFLTNPIWSDPFDFSNSTADNPAVANFIVRPNPMGNTSILEFDNPNNENTQLSIISADGKIIKQENINTNRYELRKEDFFPGIYFLEIVQNQKKSTQKLIVR
jgi:cytochrome c peroxidase